MSGQKPNVTLYFKDKKTGKFVNFAAFWTDKGRPSGGLDRRILRMKLELDGGEVVVIDNRKDQWTHYLNLSMGEAKPAPKADDDDIDF